MADELKRDRQITVKLNRLEWEMLGTLVGHRGLYGHSDLLRYGLQLVREEKETPLFQALSAGPQPKRRVKKKGGE